MFRHKIYKKAVPRTGTSVLAVVDNLIVKPKNTDRQAMGILDRFHLDGKLALVTGSATGLGAAIAIALAEAGASVACHGNRRPADETSQRIRAMGGKSQSFVADLGRRDGADTLYAAVERAMGKPE